MRRTASDVPGGGNNHAGRHAGADRNYSDAMGAHRPARTVVAVADLPKPGALLTMNLIAVMRD